MTTTRKMVAIIEVEFEGDDVDASEVAEAMVETYAWHGRQQCSPVCGVSLIGGEWVGSAALSALMHLEGVR